MKKLVDYIGEPALLEQTAEECMELAFACLKLARMKRGENKVWGHTEEELLNKLAEECADISVCVDQLIYCSSLVDGDMYHAWRKKKLNRMEDRMTLEDKKKEDEKIRYLSRSDTWSCSFSCADTDFTEEDFKKILGDKKPEEKKEEKKEEKFSREYLNTIAGVGSLNPEIEEAKRMAFESAKRIGQLSKEVEKPNEKSTSNPLVDMAAMFLAYLLLGGLGDQKKDDKDNRKA